MAEPVIEDTRTLVGRGHDGRGRTEAGPHPPVEGPQPTAAPTGRLGRQPEGLARTMAGLERVPASHVPARDLVAGGEPQPRPERLRVGPFLQVQADC
jgi:hypothetical protein